MVKVNLRIYSYKELNNMNKVQENYKIKVERDWIEKFTSDGIYYDCEDKKELKGILKGLKELYPTHNVIDKENLVLSEDDA